MTANTSVERLTPLDTLMPRTYISTLLTFPTTESICAVSPPLQSALKHLFKQLPWLTGCIFATNLAQRQRPGLEIKWNSSDSVPTLIDKGSIPEAYETLSALGMPPSSIPAGVWPVPGMIDETLFSRGAPVFAASIFRFADKQGVGLCVCMHHSAVDATGFTEVLRLWTQNMAVPGSLFNPGDGRLSRLSTALFHDLGVVSAHSLHALFASHPEYSTTPPTLPTSFPPCTSKVFRVPVTRITALKQCIEIHIPSIPTTNTVLCALIWSAITHVRKQRNIALAKETSRLATAVNGRQRIGEHFSALENLYLGKIVLYSLSELTAGDLSAFFDQASDKALATVCDAISQPQSPARINTCHIAEIYSLGDRVEDNRTMFVGWDLFRSRDLTITSWANLDLYDMEFGAQLGKPDFVRVPHAEADGVGLILPRRRASARAETVDEVVEVMIMLRKDDMNVLEQDSTWRALVGRQK